MIPSEKTPQRERRIANHPSIKPQSFLRQIVYVALPLGEGVMADPFMGSGSTVAAAEYLGLNCVGVERDPAFFSMTEKAVPTLAALEPEAVETEEIIEDQLALLEEPPPAGNGGKSNSPPSSRIRYASRSR